MPLPYKRGGVLIPENDKPHLFAVMNDECPEGQCLLLMITTIKPNRAHDASCVLDTGDHPFITHPSYVLYARALRARAAHIGRMIEKRLFIPKEDFTKPVFERIAQGIFDSYETPQGVITYAAAVKV